MSDACEDSFCYTEQTLRTCRADRPPRTGTREASTSCEVSNCIWRHQWIRYNPRHHASPIPAMHRRRGQEIGVDGGNAYGGTVIDKYSRGFLASDTRVSHWQSSTAVSKNEEVHLVLHGDEWDVGAS